MTFLFIYSVIILFTSILFILKFTIPLPDRREPFSRQAYTSFQTYLLKPFPYICDDPLPPSRQLLKIRPLCLKQVLEFNWHVPTHFDSECLTILSEALHTTAHCDTSHCMRFPIMWYVRPAKPQISLRIRADWSEPLLVAWIFKEC